MRIALVCTPLIKTPPDNYGGIERIVHWHGRNLVQEGLEVTVFGRTGSYLDGADVVEYEGGEDNGFAELVAETHLKKNFDIIHDVTHDKIFMNRYPQYNARSIATLQAMARRGPNTTCISQAQKRDLGYGDHVPVVYNLVPVDEYPPIDNPSLDYFLYMGSISDYKGVDIAVSVCKKNNQNLIIAGVAWAAEYHDKLVKPHINDIDIMWAGDVGGSKKLELLQNARALIHPVRWTEAGAIVVSEALACGTPVIGSNNGVLPELVNPAVGFICSVEHYDRDYPHMAGGCYNEEQFDLAINKIDEIDRGDCRQYAVEFLNDKIMTRDYMDIYERVYNGENWE